tara:strand:- start:52 stop:642 length:591 start_codon:yes stop_codon:yes gene_type:complete
MSKKKSQKNKKKASDSKKLNWSFVISIVAVLISLGQLFFTYPLVLKYFEKVELSATELGVYKPTNNDYLQSVYEIKNIGENPAENVELQLRIFKEGNVIFEPNVFYLDKEDKTDEAVILNNIYKCDYLVKGESVKIYIYSDLPMFEFVYRLRDLKVGSHFKKHKYDYGPSLVNLKHSKGIVPIKKSDSIKIELLDI